MNIVRVRYVQSCIQEYFGELRKCRILDVGCGAGIASEALARLGHSVVGIDPNTTNIDIAREHADRSKILVDYRNASVEDINEDFDVVVSFEVAEHVEHPKEFIKLCSKLAKNVFVISTINRNFVSLLTAKFLAENILGMLPKGTHEFEKFITVEEMQSWMSEDGVPLEPVGLVFNPVLGEWQESSITAVNYLQASIK